MKKAMIALAAVAISGTAVAGPSWTYVDAGYWRASSGDEETEGYQLRGSLGFADMWHVGASINDGEIEGGKSSSGSGADTDRYTLTIGAHPAVTDNTDLVFEATYVDGEEDSSAGQDDFDGYILTAGVRSMWSENLELNSFVHSGDIDADSGESTDIIVSAGGQYLFNDNVGVGVDVSNSAGNTANFYVRWNF